MAVSKVAGILQGNIELLGSALSSDIVVEPVRGPLIPGFGEVKNAALEHGEVLCDGYTRFSVYIICFFSACADTHREKEFFVCLLLGKAS